MSQGMHGNRPWTFVDGVFMLLLDVLHVAVVDYVWTSEAKYLGRNDGLNIAYFSSLSTGLQFNERIDEFLLIGKGGKIKQIVLYPSLIFMGGL